MNPRVQVQPLADADLDEQAAYIARDSPRSARRFYEAAEATFNFLADTPGIGNPCEFENPRAAHLRVWPVRGFENHLIFYRPVQSGIVVVRVLHGSRDLEAIFS